MWSENLKIRLVMITMLLKLLVIFCALNKLRYFINLVVIQDEMLDRRHLAILSLLLLPGSVKSKKFNSMIKWKGLPKTRFGLYRLYFLKCTSYATSQRHFWLQDQLSALLFFLTVNKSKFCPLLCELWNLIPFLSLHSISFLWSDFRILSIISILFS